MSKWASPFNSLSTCSSLGLPAREDGTGIPGVLSRTIPIESLDVTSWSVRDPEQVVAPVARELDLDREVSINPEQTRSDI